MPEEEWSYRKIEKIITGSDEGKGIKKIYDKTHKSDRGGDGVLWGQYNSKNNPHVIIIRKPVNNNVTETGKRDTQLRKKLPFSREEYEDLINHIPTTWKETIRNTSEINQYNDRGVCPPRPLFYRKTITGESNPTNDRLGFMCSNACAN